jgi:hypothetical protein
MGHGGPPGSTNVVDPSNLDDGTQPRTIFPAPEVIGLDAGSGGGHLAPPIPDAVVGFAKRKLTHHVGDHECFALADQALRAAGAFSAADFGQITGDADYIWGTQIQLDALQPGDIVQFRDYKYERKVTVDNSDGSSKWNTHSEERPHHTAVVETVDGDGAATVLEQNAPLRSTVHRTQLFFKTITVKHGNTTSEVTVEGTVWYYRPQKRS